MLCLANDGVLEYQAMSVQMSICCRVQTPKFCSAERHASSVLLACTWTELELVLTLKTRFQISVMLMLMSEPGPDQNLTQTNSPFHRTQL